MDFLDLSGTFANAPVTGFTMDGFNWDIAYNSDNIVLIAQPPLPPNLPEIPTGLMALTACLAASGYSFLRNLASTR